MYTLKNASNTAATRIEPRKCGSLTFLWMSSEFGGVPSADRRPYFCPASLAELDGQLDQRIHLPDLGGDHRFRIRI